LLRTGGAGAAAGLVLGLGLLILLETRRGHDAQRPVAEIAPVPVSPGQSTDRGDSSAAVGAQDLVGSRSVEQ
jgi:hypothetical protein